MENALEYMEYFSLMNNRLSSEMNAKIAANESSFENTSIRARPMNIAEDYVLLTSNTWLDAKTALDDLEEETTEQFKVQFLLDIMLVSVTLFMHFVRQDYNVGSGYQTGGSKHGSKYAQLTLEYDVSILVVEAC